MTNNDERAAKHRAAYDRMAAELGPDQATAIIAEADQLDALADEVITEAGGMLHHTYLNEVEHSLAHAHNLRARLRACDHDQLINLAGRLAAIVAQHRYTFTGLEA